MAAQAFGPAAAVTRRPRISCGRGICGYTGSDVESLVPQAGTTEIAGGSLVTVMDSRGIPLGSGLYSGASQIAVRMVSTEPALGREAYLAQVKERVDAALALRAELAPESEANNACRLIFSEADGLPGVIADRYKDLIVLQLLTQGTAQDDVRAVLTAALVERFGGGIALWERPDAKVRELEELAAPSSDPLHGEARRRACSRSMGCDFTSTQAAGQKTGAFLDQR